MLKDWLQTEKRGIMENATLWLDFRLEICHQMAANSQRSEQVKQNSDKMQKGQFENYQK